MIRPVSPLLVAAILAILPGCTLSDKRTPPSAPAKASKHTDPISVPVNQALTPAGIQVELPGMRPQVLALSPDGQLLATSGKNQVLLLSPRDGRILQHVPLPSEKLRGEHRLGGLEWRIPASARYIDGV